MSEYLGRADRLSSRFSAFVACSLTFSRFFFTQIFLSIFESSQFYPLFDFDSTVMEALSGESTGCVDPYVEEIEILPYQALQPHQDAVITAAEAIVQKYLVDRKP